MVDENMKILQMRGADYPAVYDLWLSCKGMGLNDLDDSAEGIDKFLRRNPHTCFVALQKDTVVGVILAGHDGRRGYIYHTAVRPDCRGKGIGSALVEAVLSAMGREGIHKVALVVFQRNEAGNGFWERRGFSERTDLVYRNKAISELVRIDT